MQISLRPHHFLCLQGYKGRNYSRSQINSWNYISQILKANPNTDILVISGKDDLCAKCPAVTGTRSRCMERNVKKLDDEIQNLLGLTIGKIYKYDEVVKDLYKKMTEDMHKKLCSGCMWWKMGLCKDTFKSKKHN